MDDGFVIAHVTACAFAGVAFFHHALTPGASLIGPKKPSADIAFQVIERKDFSFLALTVGVKGSIHAGLFHGTEPDLQIELLVPAIEFGAKFPRSPKQ